MATLPHSASPSLSPTPLVTFSYSSASFSDNGDCIKCSLFVDFEARISELEACLCTVQNPVFSQSPVVSADRTSIAPISVAPASCPPASRKPGQLGDST